MGCSNQGASAARASFRKLSVENTPARQRSQVEWCCFFSLCLGSQCFLQGISWTIHITALKWGWGMDRLSGEVSNQSAAAAPGLVGSVGSVLER